VVLGDEEDTSGSWVTITRCFLGALAGLVGIPLVFGGLLAAGVASRMDPTIAGGGQTAGCIRIGLLAAALGALLCLAAWLAVFNTKE
jgi:hypothetical protein